MHLQLGLATHTLIQSAQQGTAAGQIDTGLVDIGSQFGRSGGKGVEDSLLIYPMRVPPPCS